MFKTLLLLALISIFQSVYVYAESIPASVYGELPSKSLIVISPSGNRVAYRDKSADKDILMVSIWLPASQFLQGISLK